MDSSAMHASNPISRRLLPWRLHSGFETKEGMSWRYGYPPSLYSDGVWRNDLVLRFPCGDVYGYFVRGFGYLFEGCDDGILDGGVYLRSVRGVRSGDIDVEVVGGGGLEGGC